MVLRQDLRGRQEQRIALTPDLRYSLTILQLPLPELRSAIEEELLANCLLEREEGEDAAGPEAPEGLAGTAGRYGVTGAANDEETGPVEPGVAWDEETGRPTGALDSPRPSLREHLLFQLRLTGVGPVLRRAAAHLIWNLDDHGYLRLDLDEAARRLGLEPAVLIQALHLVQTFEPPGVGARDLRECLLIQARSSLTGTTGALALALIEGHLADLAASRYTRLASMLKVRVEEIRAAAALIRGLEPRPGRNFGPAAASPPPVPDLIIRRVDGDYQVRVREAPGPRVRISPYYRRLLSEETADGEAREYLREKLRSARRLLRCLERRRITLHRIGTALASMQGDFLDLGPAFLKPLTLHQLAARVHLHESTVSRAVAGKYAETPQGLIALSDFFPAGLAGAGDKTLSAARVREKLREAVAGEDPRHPLSDRDLSVLLAQSGCAVARRTVAKYREELGIPTANRRRVDDVRG